MAGTEGLRKRREGDDLMKLTVAQTVGFYRKNKCVSVCL